MSCLFCLMWNKRLSLTSRLSLFWLCVLPWLCLGTGNSNLIWHAVGGVVLLINEAVTVMRINHGSPPISVKVSCLRTKLWHWHQSKQLTSLWSRRLSFKKYHRCVIWWWNYSVMIEGLQSWKKKAFNWIQFRSSSYKPAQLIQNL